MGRKNLLDGLMPTTPTAEDVTTAGNAPTRKANRQRGAVGAVGRSIADLRARAVVDLDPHAIEEDGPHDRLEEDPEEEARLVASIREHGQQVPVLVRPHPEKADRWRIVYGRRRVLAAREIGVAVKALVRDLDDRAAVLAQGQENTHRRDLSFIEKANFARQLRDLGYERPAIAEAVNVDKTLLSRFLSVADRVPVAVIEAIGAAPSIGRERWLALADLCAAADWEPSTMVALAVEETGPREEGDPPRSATPSDARFDALFRALSRPAPSRSSEEPDASSKPTRRVSRQREVLASHDGTRLGTVKRGERNLSLVLDTGPKGEGSAFAEWLLTELPELHRRWMERDAFPEDGEAPDES
jgi:ParB family chromosome partitioning protein